MKALTGIDIANGAAYFSDIEREDLNLKSDAVYLTFAYTDYGGDFFDKVFITYLIEHHGDKIVWENTSYNGKNCIVTDEKLSSEIIEAINHDIFDFEDIEEHYCNMESDIFNSDMEQFLEWNDYGDNKESVLEWLYENRYGYYRLTTQGIDYCESELLNDLSEAGFNVVD